jgi:dTDP-4-amino-4,6-dideoxygalactose transaminase
VKLCTPFTDQAEIDEVAALLATGHLTQGPKVAEFEQAIARLLGAKHALATTSCTTALHLSLVALGVGPGDDVLVPDFTFPATANVVVHQGARPVLVDVRTDTYTIDVDDLERRITPRTRAIMPVHAFGLSADMDAIMSFARDRRLAVVEDSACALMARYRGRFCGTIGDLGCFSFHPRKSITTGEGGMIVTNDDDLAQRLAVLRSHGGVRGDLYLRFVEAGFNYRMSDIQAAVGVAQVRKLDWILNRRREIASEYTRVLGGVKEVTSPAEPEGYYHSFQSYVVMLGGSLDRDKVIAAMRRRSFETTLGTYALHVQPYFQRRWGSTPGDLPGSYRAFRQALTLPLFPQMDPDDPGHVAAALAESVNDAER